MVFQVRDNEHPRAVTLSLSGKIQLTMMLGSYKYCQLKTKLLRSVNALVETTVVEPLLSN